MMTVPQKKYFCKRIDEITNQKVSELKDVEAMKSKRIDRPSRTWDEPEDDALAPGSVATGWVHNSYKAPVVVVPLETLE